MAEKKRPEEETPRVESPLLDENRQPAYKPYDRKTRIKAWIGVAFMIFLTLMYFYVFASGQILNW